MKHELGIKISRRNINNFRYADGTILKRYYAHEVHVPDDYMIVDAESFTPSSVYEEVRMIRVNPRQVAIPMTWFFKLKDMTIYEQWDFLRVYRLDIPYKLKAKTYLDDALSTAYDFGMEADFLNMFYDMLRDNPEEFKRRKGLLSAKKKEIWNRMDSILVQAVGHRCRSIMVVADSDDLHLPSKQTHASSFQCHHLP